MIFQDFILKVYTISIFASLLTIIAELLIIIAGLIHYRKKNAITLSILLTISGSIIVLWIILLPRISLISGLIPGISFEEIRRLEWILYYIISGILDIICFGLIFIILGIKNKRNYGYLFFSSGISRIIAEILIYVFALLSYSHYYFNMSPPKIHVLRIANILFYIGQTLIMISYSLLLIYSIRSTETYIGLSSLLAFFSTSIIFIFNYYYLNLIT